MFAIKIVGAALGLVSVVAGLSIWMAVGSAHETWRESKRTPTRLQPAVDAGRMKTTTVILVAVAAGLNALHCWLGRLVTRPAEFMSLSRGAWRGLLLGCHATGLVLGAWIYFSSPV